jgi:hypothetical protein
VEGVGDTAGERVVTPFRGHPGGEVGVDGLAVAVVGEPGAGVGVVGVGAGGTVEEVDVGVGAVDVVVEDGVAHSVDMLLERRGAG